MATTFKSFNELSEATRSIIMLCKSEENRESKYSLVSNQRTLAENTKKLDSTKEQDLATIDKTEFAKLVTAFCKVVTGGRVTASGAIKDIYTQLSDSQWTLLTGVAHTNEMRNLIITNFARDIHNVYRLGEVYRHTFTFERYEWSIGADKAKNAKVCKGIPANLSDYDDKWKNEHRRNLTINVEEYDAIHEECPSVNENTVLKYTEYERTANVKDVVTYLLKHRNDIIAAANDARVAKSSK